MPGFEVGRIGTSFSSSPSALRRIVVEEIEIGVALPFFFFSLFLFPFFFFTERLSVATMEDRNSS